MKFVSTLMAYNGFQLCPVGQLKALNYQNI